MSDACRVALLGFSDFERSALGSYFRLASQRQPRYMQVARMDEAQFVVADADQPGVLEQLRQAGRLADALFVGAQSPMGAALWMMRPIDPLNVMRELDAMLAARGGAGVTISLPLAAPAAPREGVQPARRSDDVKPLAPALQPRPAQPAALLVDDSDIALRFLERQLQAYHLPTQRASSSAQALEWLQRAPFGFVFLDVELGEQSDMDGLSLCQQIKRQPMYPGGRTPVVVMLSAHQGPVDQVRGTLAGCDAYLGKPLDRAALAAVLAEHGVPAAGPQPPRRV